MRENGNGQTNERPNRLTAEKVFSLAVTRFATIHNTSTAMASRPPSNHPSEAHDIHPIYRAFNIRFLRPKIETDAALLLRPPPPPARPLFILSNFNRNRNEL